MLLTAMYIILFLW